MWVSDSERDIKDDHRLPEGMTRVGYDADTQIYTYQDEDSNYWEGSPGAGYGSLTRGMSYLIFTFKCISAQR